MVLGSLFIHRDSVARKWLRGEAAAEPAAAHAAPMPASDRLPGSGTHVVDVWLKQIKYTTRHPMHGSTCSRMLVARASPVARDGVLTSRG